MKTILRTILRAMLDWLRGRLVAWACLRAPDFVIGGHAHPYLLRWWLTPWTRRRKRYDDIPRGERTLWQRFVCWLPGVYVHLFLRSDDDRALHDHPFSWNASWIMDGRYREWLSEAVFVEREAGQWKLRRGAAPHRIELTHGPCWTLFITGANVREWGFYCPKGWVHWRVFTAPGDAGTVGRGCE